MSVIWGIVFKQIPLHFSSPFPTFIELDWMSAKPQVSDEEMEPPQSPCHQQSIHTGYGSSECVDPLSFCPGRLPDDGRRTGSFNAG